MPSEEEEQGESEGSSMISLFGPANTSSDARSEHLDGYGTDANMGCLFDCEGTADTHFHDSASDKSCYDSDPDDDEYDSNIYYEDKEEGYGSSDASILEDKGIPDALLTLNDLTKSAVIQTTTRTKEKATIGIPSRTLMVLAKLRPPKAHQKRPILDVHG